ncbi:MAG: S41 family peptidase [Bacteroidota bacterium]
MLRFKIFLTLILSGTQLFCQDQCDCKKVVQNVALEIEANSASFADQVYLEKQMESYEKYKSFILDLASLQQTKIDCIGIVALYLAYLKDAHQQIYGSQDFYRFSLSDAASVQAFFDKHIAYKDLQAHSSEPSLLGKWVLDDGSLTIHIQRGGEKGRAFTGLLVSSNRDYWKKGAITLEIFEQLDHQLTGVIWSEWLQAQVGAVKLNEDTLQIGRFHTFYREEINQQDIAENQQYEAFQLVELMDSISYLRLPTFQYQYVGRIDSIITANHARLLVTKHLVLDLRGNAGGSDYAYQSLLPYIMDKREFTEPITTSIWVSQDNWEGYYEERYDYGVESAQDSLAADGELQEMARHIGSFEPIQYHPQILDTVYSYPKQISILIDENCASTTESFLMVAGLSDKVKTYGSPTKGAASYGEWRRIDIPELDSWISLTQKRFSFLDHDNFELIGIAPDIFLKKKDWSEVVLAGTKN